MWIAEAVHGSGGDPSSALDWARALAAFLGGVTAGAVLAVIRRYRELYAQQGTVRQKHVVLISISYLLLVGAMTYAQLALIGQEPTRVSWVVVIVMICALPIGMWALWLILGHASSRDRARK